MTSTILRATLALACACAFVPTASAALLSDLINGDTIAVDDKVFSNFAWTSTVDPANVTVTGVTIGDEHGLEFTSNALLLTSGGGLSAVMNYTVTVTDPQRVINGNTLSMVATGSGNASVSETPTDAAGLVTLLPSAKLVIRQAGINLIPQDHKDYLNEVTSVNVLTAIDLAWSGSGTGPQIHSFTQTFQQGFFDITIPEPSTIGLALIGGLFGTAVLLRRRWG